MTMLELLELQARARAIRSQLALEPITKIELTDDEADEENGEASEKLKGLPNSSNNSTKQNEEKSPDVTKQPGPVAKAPASVLIVKRAAPPPPPPMVKPTPSAKPMKLKRNYKSQTSDGAASAGKEVTPPKVVKKDDDDDRCSSPDVITMDPDYETFFISDSDDEPPLKKSPEKREASPEKVVAKTPEKEVEPEKDEVPEQQEPEEGEVTDDEKEEAKSPSKQAVKSSVENSPLKIAADDNAMVDDDSVHSMSDTEIELHHLEDDEPPSREKSVEKPSESPKKPAEIQQSTQSDDDVVEIHNSSDDEMMNESDKSTGESAKPSQTWEERWLSSSKTQNILKTTQLASKVRDNMLKTKKSQKASEKKKAESDKAMKEKLSNMEEGSIEQFKSIQDSSNSSVN